MNPKILLKTLSVMLILVAVVMILYTLFGQGSVQSLNTTGYVLLVVGLVLFFSSRKMEGPGPKETK